MIKNDLHTVIEQNALYKDEYYQYQIYTRPK